MTGELNILFVILGSVSLLLGLGMLALALRNPQRDQPKGVAMLIAGMMVTAFGLLMAGFAIAYATSEPLDLNAEAVS
jgi:hypothetical protein